MGAKVKASPIRKGYETRFVIVDTETGEILDDAQGYGYKTAQKAYAAWGYKHRDRSKDKEKRKKREEIQKWLNSHKFFERDMEQYAFEIECKGSWGPDDHFDSKFVKKMLEEYGFTDLPFTASELFREWQKR